MSYWIQFIFALPLLLGGIGCFVGVLLNPGSIGLIRLSLYSFALQFCLGPVLALFNPASQSMDESADVLLAWMTIYAFWLGIFLTALIWRNRLDPVLVARDRGISSERGILAALMDASLRMSALNAVFFYLLVAGVRVFMLVKYGVGLSGTSTLDRIMGLPYWILVIHKTFYALGLAFVFLAMVKILNRSPGWYLFIPIIMLEILYAFTQGRRRLYAVAVLLMFGFLIKHGRIKVRHAIIGAFVGVLLWQVAFPFFVSMRLQWQRNPDAPVSAWIENAWREARTGGEYGEQRQQYNRSVHDRLEALSFNYTIAHQLNTGMRSLKGEVLKNAAINLVPRFLFPAKLEMVYEDDDLVEVRLGLPSFDAYSNFPAFALADFGMLGGLFYGFILAFVLRAVELMMKILLRRDSVGAFAIFSVIGSNVVLQMEFSPGTFSADVRLILFVFLGFYALSAVFGSSAAHPGAMQEDLAANPYGPSPRWE